MQEKSLAGESPRLAEIVRHALDLGLISLRSLAVFKQFERATKAAKPR